MLKKLSEKLRAKSSHGKNCPSLRQQRFVRSCFYLQASPIEGQSLQQKEKKRIQRKGEKKLKIGKPKDGGHFLVLKL